MIKLKNVNFSYRSQDDEKEIVLKDLTFNIKKNKHTCILGHNGSGKSTLAKLLVGLYFCDSGSIEIDGVEINEDNVYDIRNLIGIVFQNPDNQFIGSSVQDDIAFGLENHCVKQSEMADIINKYATMVGMQDYLDSEPSRLSGGQKQRVAIAGILAMNPKIMIFDEATSMLDPSGVIEVNESIDSLNNNNEKTIISITHDINYALKADEIIVLDRGSVLYQGLPCEVFKHSQQLIDIGLDIPLALKISNALNKQGVLIEDCLSIKELETKLCQLKSQI